MINLFKYVFYRIGLITTFEVSKTKQLGIQFKKIDGWYDCYGIEIGLIYITIFLGCATNHSGCCPMNYKKFLKYLKRKDIKESIK